MNVLVLFVLAAAAQDERVVIESDGWELVADWRVPEGREEIPAALLLHRAAGSRAEYVDLARALAARGVASLRIDLRANGESVNRGRFEEPYAENLGLLEGTDRDIGAALRWIRSQPRVDAARIGIVAASYSGEMVGDALRNDVGEKAAAYVMLSPGSFSDESIAEVVRSGAPWLFIRTVNESPASLEFIDPIFDALESRAPEAERRVLDGSGHATRIFDSHPEVVEEIARWLQTRLRPR